MYEPLKRNMVVSLALALVACGGTEPAPPRDQDGDGYTEDIDCDDLDAAIHPDADEVCDGADNDCDGVIDGDDSIDAPVWFGDTDGDGYGLSDDQVSACEAPEGYVEDDSDCDDDDSEVHPGAGELCDGVDNDCDGEIDDGFDDVDEVCDGEDNDCDGEIDEDAVDGATWYLDDDGDGAGDPDTATTACEAPEGYVAGGDDCDDGDATVHPGAEEICGNDIDEDCSGVADDGCPTEHCGNVTEDTTWSADFIHHVTCPIYVQGAAEPILTIEDGAEVIFDTGTGLYVGYAEGGSLVVEGASEGVTFGASGAAPEPGDWLGVLFGRFDNASVIEGLTVTHAGATAGANGAIRCIGASPTLIGVTVSDSASHGFYGERGCTPAVSGSTFRANAEDGFHLSQDSSLATGPTPTFIDNVLTENGGRAMVLPVNSADQLDASSSFTGNDLPGVHLLMGTVDHDGTWQAIDEPYFLNGAVYVQGVLEPVLTIADGVRAILEGPARLFVGYSAGGALVVDGATTGVVFESSSRVPEPGDWAGLFFGTHDNHSVVTGLTVSSAGATGARGAVECHGAEVTLQGCTIDGSLAHGFYGAAGCVAAISDTTITGCEGDGVNLTSDSALASGGAPSFADNVVTGNEGRAAVLPAASASQLDASSSFAGNTTPGVYLTTDSIEEDSTWQALDEPYFWNQAIYVQGPLAPVLTIADGARFTAEGAAVLFVGYSDAGALVVEGSGAGVTVTSSSVVPEPGDYGGFYLGTHDTGSVLTGLTVEYAGALGTNGAVVLVGASPVLEGCSIRSSGAAGLHGSRESFPTISGSTFSNNARDGIFLSSDSGLGRGLTPSFTGNALTANGRHGIAVPAGFGDQLDASSSYAGNTLRGVLLTTDTVEQTGTWQALDEPYLLNGNVHIQGEGDPILTIAPGATLTFEGAGRLLIGYSDVGGILAIGTAAEPITFTSASSSPSPGDWAGLYFGASCIGASSILEHSVVEYGGSTGTRGNVLFHACNGRISSSTIRYSGAWGIYRELGADPTLESITYLGNASGDLF